MPQKDEHRIWKVIELFYKSCLSFRHIHDEYEEKVTRYTAEKGISRERLELNPADLADLFEFQKLEELRDRYLWALKDFCHTTFRGSDNTELLDRYVSDIFHEISILKEEHYTVEHYAPLWARADAQREYQSIMEEAGRLFPQKVDHIDFLFAKARERLERLLIEFRELKILVRSLFLNRRGFVAECYAKGIEGFYEIMYPENGPIEGYDRAGMSFFNSGFYANAIEALEEGLACSQRREKPCPGRARIIASMQEHIKKSREALGQLAEAETIPVDTDGA